MSEKPITRSITYIIKRSVINTGVWVPAGTDGMDTKKNKTEILGLSANDYSEGARLHLTAILDLETESSDA